MVRRLHPEARDEFGAETCAGPPPDFVPTLFAAASLDAIASVAVREAQRTFGCSTACIVTLPDTVDDPRQLHRWGPTPPPLDIDLDLVDAALRDPNGTARKRSDETRTVVAAHALATTAQSESRAAFIAEWPDCAVPEPSWPVWRDFLTLVAARITNVLELQAQRLALERLEKHAQLQKALFTIADLASGRMDMIEMLRRIHAVVGELMYARNFYIALYDKERDSVRFIYFADEQDRPVSPDEEFPAERLRDSLTLAVIRRRQSAMGPSAKLRGEFGLAFDPSYGPDSADWLGVPMNSGDDVRGAVVVQSYDVALRYTEEDRALLTFVAQHILTTLIRKQAHEELERRVEERTRELTTEVRERQRGEKLQAALYSIADLASSELDMNEMLRSIHAVVGELMYAKNFYIALYNVERDALHFIYHADEKDPGLVGPEEEIPAAALESSLTLGLIRHGRATMGAARDVASKLSVPGGIGLGTPAEDFLGVPMIAESAVRGVVVVQSYDPSVHYVEEDRVLLAYVAQHILTALARKQAQAELERRVEDRTRALAAAVNELREQVRERERVEQRLMHETLHDSLTGLPNRSFLYTALEHALARSQRDPGHRFAVLFLDLDRFKVVNDSVGHLIGDEMLKEAGTRLAACVRAPDVVARLGGDEFALLLEDTRTPEDACHVAQRVIDALSEPMRIGGKELFSSASVGIALSHERYRSAEELLRDADVAMYRAKAHGRQRFEIFDERLHQEALRLLDMESDLRRAIQRAEFEPFFQPIVRLGDRRVIGYEALLRWRHPVRGLMLPGEFIGVAEESGSIEQIDWQMYERTCQQMASLDPDVYVTINVSPRHFRSPALARQILDMLKAYGLEPQRIRLEVTEGALFDNPDQVLTTLDALRRAGVVAVLDDFGTGYSSLSYLHRFPLRALKIDRSFVTALRPGEGGSAAVVNAVIAMARTLGLEVIAEGIETSDQRDYLMDIGCEQGQGYLFSRARPASDWAEATAVTLH